MSRDDYSLISNKADNRQLISILASCRVSAVTMGPVSTVLRDFYGNAIIIH